MRKKVFNYRISRARRISENTFGIMAIRWSVLRQTLEVTPDHAIIIVRAIVVLHNFMQKSVSANTSYDRYFKGSNVDHENQNGVLIPGNWSNDSSSTMFPVAQQGTSNFAASAAHIRRIFTSYLSNQGAVPWQDAIVNRGTFPLQ